MGRKLVLRCVAAAAFAGGLGAFPYLLDREVPLLDLFDLGIHELGHMVTVLFGGLVHVLAGSVAQVIVPLGLAAYFWLRDEMSGTGVCLAWAGTSMHDVSIYIADAPFQVLQLIGGGHDWAYLLGPQQFDSMESAQAIADAVAAAGAVAVVVGMLAALWPLVPAWRSEGPPDLPRRVRPARPPTQASEVAATGSRHRAVMTRATATTNTSSDDPT